MRSIRRWLLLFLPATLVVVGFSTPAHAADYGSCRGVYRIQAANGLYVSAEANRSDYPGLLRARTPGDQLGTWEQFQVWEQKIADTWYYSFKAHNGRYADAYESFNEPMKGALIANASSNNTYYKRFQITSGWVFGGFVLIRNAQTQKYVAADESLSGNLWGTLRARTPGEAVGNWEKFRFSFVHIC